MPFEVVAYMLSNKDMRARMQFQLIFQCAPFLKGLKIACITNLEEDTLDEIESIFAGTGIDYKILTVCKGRCLLFFYRKRELEDYLERADVRDFLEAYGYKLNDIEQMLAKLSDRVCQYYRRDISFPHEIGAFLDYPIEDVEDFIEKDGKNSVLSGYWKVYHNPGKAQMTFYAYDKARISAVNEFLTGKTIREIAYKTA